MSEVKGTGAKESCSTETQQENYCHQWWYTREDLFMMVRLMN